MTFTEQEEAAQQYDSDSFSERGKCTVCTSQVIGCFCVCLSVKMIAQQYDSDSYSDRGKCTVCTSQVIECFCVCVCLLRW